MKPSGSLTRAPTPKLERSWPNTPPSGIRSWCHRLRHLIFVSTEKCLFSQGRCSLSKFKKTDTLIFIYLFTYLFIVRSTIIQLGNLHPWVTTQYTLSPQIQLGEEIISIAILLPLNKPTQLLTSNNDNLLFLTIIWVD